MNKKYTMFLWLLITTLGIHSIFAQKQPLLLRYDKPAVDWTEALPLGNGYMGAMLFGDPFKEHLQLNEGTLYSGDPKSTFKNINVRKHYKEVVDFIKAKKYQEAQAIIRKEWLGRNHQLYEPMGDFWIDFKHKSDAFTDYERTLDLSTATANVHYKVDKTIFKRQYFANYPDHILAIKIEKEGLDKINCTLHFSTPHTPTAKYFIENKNLVMQGKAPGFALRRDFKTVEQLGDQHKYPELYDNEGKRKPNISNFMYDKQIDGLGMAFETQVKTTVKGGKIIYEGDKITIQEADEVVFVLTAATSYNGFDKSPVTEGVNPSKKINNYFKAIATKKYSDLYSTHLKDYKNLFDRVSINLGADTEQSKLPTDKRVELFSNGKDPSFTALYFQFGRYLMIAGSRPNGQPLNLQGIWNDKLVPPWNGAYTININAQMNYWAAETANLAECQEPFFKAIKELAINGKETAKNMYGTDGWVAHHNMDIWRHTEPIDNCNCSFWNMGSGWLVSHFWEHYLFSSDTVFLKNEVFPLLKGVVQFYEGWLVENEKGYLITPVGMSPEHEFIYGDNKRAAFTEAPTMDMAIVRETYSRYIKACKILGIKDDFTTKIEQDWAKLLPYQIGKYGQLQEWAEDFEDSEKEHRHVSHLYALHPSNQISVQHTPELAAAARRSMERRGDEATGWSMGWKVNLWARLLDGERAFKLITRLFTLIHSNEQKMTGGGTYPNLFDAHPPFQIDGNFGVTAGIAEMLIQSQNDEIVLLPALPSAWKNGSITGLKARGGVEVSIFWQNGQLEKTVLKASKSGVYTIRYGTTVKNVDLQAGKIFIL
jgi:alpha-L-fucosidase 2